MQFGVYIHFPYCLSKCPYCDFNSHVVAEIPASAGDGGDESGCLVDDHNSGMILIILRRKLAATDDLSTHSAEVIPAYWIEIG